MHMLQVVVFYYTIQNSLVRHADRQEANADLHKCNTQSWNQLSFERPCSSGDEIIIGLLADSILCIPTERFDHGTQ